MTAERPSRLIYLRKDKKQIWRTVDSPYELGYVAGEADAQDGRPQMTYEEHQALWGANSEYSDGYEDAYFDQGECPIP